MGWYAVDAIEDAGALAKRFLFPLSLRRIVTLAVIVFFLGGGSGGGGGGQGIMNFSTDIPEFTHPFPSPFAMEALPFYVLVSIGVLLVIALLYAIIGSVFRFVFVDALRTGDVRISGPARRWFRVGLQLFAFQALAALVVAGPVLAGIWFAFQVEPSRAVLLVALLPVVAVLGLAAAITIRLTVDFVVPVAILEETGLLASWRTFWSTLRGDLGQFVVYLVVRWLIGLVIGVLAGIVLAVFTIPFALVGAGIAAAISIPLGGFNPFWLVPLAIPFVLIIAAISTFIQIPVQSYLGYYALLVLGDANESLDLIPDRRADVRGDSTIDD